MNLVSKFFNSKTHAKMLNHGDHFGFFASHDHMIFSRYLLRQRQNIIMKKWRKSEKARHFSSLSQEIVRSRRLMNGLRFARLKRIVRLGFDSYSLVNGGKLMIYFVPPNRAGYINFVWGFCLHYSTTDRSVCSHDMLRFSLISAGLFFSTSVLSDLYGLFLFGRGLTPSLTTSVNENSTNWLCWQIERIELILMKGSKNRTKQKFTCLRSKLLSFYQSKKCRSLHTRTTIVCIGTTWIHDIIIAFQTEQYSCCVLVFRLIEN